MILALILRDGLQAQPMRQEDEDGELDIRRPEPEEFERFDPDWDEVGEAGA